MAGGSEYGKTLWVSIKGREVLNRFITMNLHHDII